MLFLAALLAISAVVQGDAGPMCADGNACDATSLLQTSNSLTARSSEDLVEFDAAASRECTTKALGYSMFGNPGWPGFGAEHHGWTTKCSDSDDECQISVDMACTVPPQQLKQVKLTSLLSNPQLADVKTGSANPRWKGKVLRIRAPVMGGFFQRAQFVMTTAPWAAANNIPFFVDMEEAGYNATTGIGKNSRGLNKIDAYYDPDMAGDRWEQYFKPVNGLTKDEVYSKTKKIVELSDKTAWWFHVKQNQIYGPKDFESTTADRWTSATQVAEWVKPTDEVWEAADKAWEQATASFAEKTSFSALQPSKASSAKPQTVVLGVQLRGTDRGGSPLEGGKVDPVYYFPYIDKFISYHEPKARVLIFFASDDEKYLKRAMDRYKGRAFTQDEVPRASGKSTIWIESDTSKAHKKGVSVLVDMLMLSKCDFLIKPASTVAEFAIYFNPALITNSIDMSIADQPLPQWARELPQTWYQWAYPTKVQREAATPVDSLEKVGSVAGTAAHTFGLVNMDGSKTMMGMGADMMMQSMMSGAR